MEKRLLPKAGEFYRHFKGWTVCIIAIAKHTETNEYMVVYRHVTTDFESSTYVRPLKMFMSEVDHEKYPDIDQTYRFERL